MGSRIFKRPLRSAYHESQRLNLQAFFEQNNVLLIKNLCRSNGHHIRCNLLVVFSYQCSSRWDATHSPFSQIPDKPTRNHFQSQPQYRKYNSWRLDTVTLPPIWSPSEKTNTLRMFMHKCKDIASWRSGKSPRASPSLYVRGFFIKQTNFQ